MRILSIVGTRPEAVKMAPIIQALARTPGIESKVCATAQHREMLDQVLRLFSIQPDFDLNVMKPNQSLTNLTAKILKSLEPVIVAFKPDWILAQGDTTTVMVTSILAYYHRICFGHVEAGLRTGDKWQPFPEEINRKIAGVTADLHFAPTEWARDNLLRENVPESAIVVTGNTVIDALHQVIQLPEDPSVTHLFHQIGITDEPWPRLILVTAHRRENFGEPLENICQALINLAEKYADQIRILYPVHRNPNVVKTVNSYLRGRPGIFLIDPLDYLPMIQVMKKAYLVLTDSGGLQEEAPGLGVPTLVLRSTTERPEGVQAGTLRLIGTQASNIISEVRRLMDDPVVYKTMAHAINPYGDGQAAHRIVRALLDRMNS